MNFADRFRTTVLIFLLVPAAAFGQLTLRGSVTDSVTHEALVGANVYFPGSAFGGVTDREGKFLITRVPAGLRTVRASYLGYKVKDVTLTDGINDQTINFRLVPDVIEGSEVVVTGQMRGQVAAINQQLTSNTIVNVVSEEKIKELPDANAAEAIGRLPGVSVIRSGGEATKVVLRGLSEKFSTITIDGMRMAPTDSNSRDVDLSAISQSSLAGIELFKALTPDMDGDAIAGSVNLVTRKAPSVRSVRIDASGDYSKLDNTAKQYEFSARYGERFFEDLLGVQLVGNLERRSRSNEELNLDYDLNFNGHATDYAITQFTLDYTNEIRKRGGLSLLLDIETPDSGSIRVNNIYNRTDRQSVLYTRNYPTNNTAVAYTARDRHQQIDTYNSSIRGNNFLFGFKTGWSLSFAQSRSEFPYDYELDFTEPAMSVNGTPTSGMNRIPASALKGPPETLIQYALNNFGAAYLNWGYASSLTNFDKEKGASLDLSRDYAIGSLISGTVKFGGKYRYTNRFKQGSQLAAPYYINHFYPWTMFPDGSVVNKLRGTFVGTRFENLALLGGNILATNFLDAIPANRNVFDKYSLFPLLSDDALRTWYDLNKSGVSDSLGRGSEYSRNNEVDANYYNIIERISAGYLMNTLNIGEEITFMAGARVESESNDYFSKYSPGPLTGFPTPLGTILDTSATHTETVWLPNFQLTWRPLDFMNVRLAVFKAMARPDFNQRINNFIERNSGGGSGGVVLFVGNPRLRDAQAWHYEVNTSFFSNTIGLLTLSAYYMDIKDIYHLIDGMQTSGQALLDSLGIPWKATFAPGIIYDLTYPLNSDQPTRVWGFEIEHQVNLNFLPGLLRNFVLSYNASLVRSETYVLNQVTRADTTIVHDPDFGDTKLISYSRHIVQKKQKLEGQPEFFGNVALGYDIGGFSARVSVFFQGEYNSSFSIDERNDQVVNSFTRWDFSAKQQITDNFAVLLSLNNLTNAEEGTSIKNRVTGWVLPNTNQTYGLSASLGVRVTL